jgi:hypothetical protein
MRLLLGVLGAGALAFVGWIGWRATVETREWRELLALGAKDKRDPAETLRFVALAQRCFPEESKAVYAPAVIRAFHGGTLAAFTSPTGRGDLHVHLLDESRRPLSTTSIAAGVHGCGLEFKVPSAPVQGHPSFEIKSSGPASATTHHYVVVDRDPLLVRISAWGKKPIQNIYEDRNQTFGPPLPPDALTRCEAGLASASVPVVLEALVWLSGHHAPGSPWEELRQRPSVSQKVSELTRSAQPWVADAARLVEK